MGKIKDLLNQKISLSDLWQSFALSFLFKKKKENRDLGPLISYKTADVVKLCVSKDVTGFEKLYPNSDGGFEHEMIRKAMVNELVEHLVKSDLINWYKSNGDDYGFPNTQLKAEIWVAKK
jgi:hypothetical protein